MTPLRSGLLAAAGSPWLRRFAERSTLTRPVVSRFVAGALESEALATTAALLASNRLVTLDFLGEDVTTRDQADVTVQAYRSLLSALSATGSGDRAEVSVKLSAIGGSLPGDGEKIALDNARAICASAASAGTTVTLDMEDHTTTDSTLAAVVDLRADFPLVGAVVQAYLRRTESDCRDLAVAGSRVRLCKGAYAEPESVAFRGAEVDESYRRCMEILLAGKGYPMLATHDPAMISSAQAWLDSGLRTPESYEFQMLLGIRPDEQAALAAAGHQMRVYVPYGDQWYGYFMRRLAERPANLRFFLRALASKR